MACCFFKRCCGCFELKIGSLLIGFILLAIKAIWLVFSSNDIYLIKKYSPFLDLNETKTRTAIVLSVVKEVRLILEVMFTIILLFGLLKNKRGCMSAFIPPSVICYVVEIVAFIYESVYYGIYIVSVLSGLIFVADIITKLLTPYFLLLVRSQYHQTEITDNTGTVYSASPKQSKLGVYYV